MPAYAVVGGQWGDEGKGKVVDYLAERSHMVARYSGGNNAGHTVINSMGEFKFHLVPAGIFWPQVKCVIGNGAVVDPGVLADEVNSLIERKVNTSYLYLSDRAHIIMPYHILLDKADEASRGASAIGTTGRGVGPAYVDKAARSGIRAGDLLDLERLYPRLKHVVELKNKTLVHVYGASPVSVEEVYEACKTWVGKVGQYIRPVQPLIEDTLKRGQRILLEGAQGTMLDVDHGTYPYVTSSSSAIGGAFAGMGISPFALVSAAGVFKAYCTRVGAGPMPTEMFDGTGEAIRERAWEYGATTGRPRRVGWFDAVAGRYSAFVNGLTTVVITRLDVLDGFDAIKVCVAYELDGKKITHFPAAIDELERCKPVYETIKGWSKPTAAATHMSQLPPEAVHYVRRIEELLGVPVNVISTGPKREETIQIRPIL